MNAVVIPIMVAFAIVVVASLIRSGQGGRSRSTGYHGGGGIFSDGGGGGGGFDGGGGGGGCDGGGGGGGC